MLGKAERERKDQARTWRLIRVRGNKNGQKSLFQEGAVLEQYIPFGDGLGDTRGHQYGSATQDNDLIGVKDCIAVFIKNDQFVAVFLFDLLAKLAYAGLVSCVLKFILLVHPGLEGGGKGHGDNGQINMGAEGGGIVAGGTLNEPCLLGLPKHGVFYLTSGIIAVIDLKGFVYRGVGEDNEGVGIGVIDLVRVGYDHDSVDRVGVKSERFS
ncbi:MAG: hypothetical protein KKA34_06755 [Candidatus Omnitrophica bacterium]|nr:hypothetical protein [Candidatus Omnitrophota bacterium]